MQNPTHPRVLIVSHAAFSDTTNTGITLSSFFRHWDADAVAQLFFHTEVPRGPMCRRYYRITDFDALGSVLGRRPCGRIMDSVAGISVKTRPAPSPLQQRMYEFGRKKYPSAMLLRDAIWRAARWRTRELSAWVNDFSPDVVFLTGGQYTFAYAIAWYLARSRAVPLVVFLGDDVYSVCSFSASPFFWLQKALIRRTMRRVVGSAARLFSTCDLMGEEYRRIFGVKYTTLPTACERVESEPAPGARTPVVLSYLGNVLYFARWTTLRGIGEALREINAGQQRAILRIYTTERLDNRMLQCLNMPGAMEFKGGLSAAEAKQVMVESDILVHVEAMDKVSRKLTRLSLSTKIPQYLASGRCILAVGPDEAASVRYVQNYETGMAITDLETLRQNVEALISRPELRQRYALNGLRLAQQRHDSRVVSDLLVTTLRGVLASKPDIRSVLATESL